MNFAEYIDSPIFWLRRAWLATDKSVDGCFADHTLSAAQYEILGQLWQEDGLEQRVLQERLGVSSATLTGVTDGLVERHLVERRLSVQDARVKCLFLTAQGRSLERELGRKIEQLQDCLLQGMSATERLIVKEWLKRMAANISGDCADTKA